MRASAVDAISLLALVSTSLLPYWPGITARLLVVAPGALRWLDEQREEAYRP
jgi:hypothetical protein